MGKGWVAEASAAKRGSKIRLEMRLTAIIFITRPAHKYMQWKTRNAEQK